MGRSDNRTTSADVLAVFGVTGDLCHKMIFPALYAMARRSVQQHTMDSAVCCCAAGKNV